MLFFFELFLFVLVMLTLALGEFVSRWLALVLWSVVTAFCLIGYLFARQALAGFAAGDRGAASAQPAPGGIVEEEPGDEAQADPAHAPADPTPLDERWMRTLLYNWRRSNALLVLGVVVVAAWYWLAG